MENKEKVTLSVEELEMVSGGYSRETWEKMTTDERITAYKDSETKRAVNEYCAYDDKTI